MPSSKPASPKAASSVFLEAALSRRRAAPWIMGVVNATPDSFYAESRSASFEAARDAALRLIDEGADMIDIGGQSTRPGSEAVTETEELRRVVPVFEVLSGRVTVPLSIDTDKAAVAEACREAGASVLNDVSALRGDPRMAEAALGFAAVILMHRGGRSPKTMQDHPSYANVVQEVLEFLRERREAFAAGGGDPRRVWIDPGIGFGKELGHNLSLLKRLADFSALGPVVLGASRKSFIGKVLGDAGPSERLEGSLAAACWAALSGVKILRVHDVRQTRRALDILSAIGAAA